MRRALLMVLAVVLAVCAVPTTWAYSSTMSYKTADNVMPLIMSYGVKDSCTFIDPGSYITMPSSATKQNQIVDVIKSNGITANVPLGGATMQATCTAQLCEWKWIRGLYYFVRPTFYQGVYYTGPSSSALSSPTLKGAAVSGSYTNWDTNFPISWSNLSYWGKRIVVLQPSNNKWKNVEVSTRFSQLICEHYTYTNSDGANGIIPTFPGGSAIPITSSSQHVYSYCGTEVKKDSQGRWMLPKCGNKFPWWAGLVIAVVCYVILIAVIITAWCCCCVNRRNKEEKHRQKVVGAMEDNTGNIPSQSELGLSRSSSFSGQRSTSNLYRSNELSNSSGSFSSSASKSPTSSRSSSSRSSSSRHNSSRSSSSRSH